MHVIKRARFDIAIVGLRRLIGINRPVLQRIAWAIILLVGLIFTLYQLYQRIAYYLSRPVLTEITIEHKHVMSIPGITLCAVYAGRDFKPNFSNRPMDMKVFNSIKNPTIEAKPPYDFNWTRFMQNIWPKPPIKWCGFASNERTKSTRVCSLADFQPPEITNAGYRGVDMNCQTLRKNWQMSAYGRLVLQVNKTVENYRPVIYAVIHQADEQPNLQEMPIRIYTVKNGTTRIMIYFIRTETDLVDWSCETPYSRRLKYFDQYTKNKCITECLYNFSVSYQDSDNCNCFAPFGQPVLNATKVCKPHLWQKCFEKQAERFEENDYKYKDACRCRPLCTQQFYQIHATHSSITSTMNADNNYYKIIFKYGSDNVMRDIQRPALTVSKLLAEIGGIFALILGIRLITMFEIVDVLIMSIIEWRNGKKRNDTKKTVSSLV